MSPDVRGGPSIAVGLAAMAVLALLVVSIHTQDYWWPAYPYYMPRKVGSYADAIEPMFEDGRRSAVYLGIAAVQVAGGRPRNVTVVGDPVNPTLEEMFGSVLHKAQAPPPASDLLNTAQQAGQFKSGPGGVQVTAQVSAEREVLVLIDGEQRYVMPLEWVKQYDLE